MKQILLIAFIVISTFCNAQQFYEKLSFTKYEKWINNIKIPEYKFYAVEKEGEAEYNETVKYKATFIKGQTDRLSINLGSIGEFNSILTMAKQKGERIFKIKSCEMVYVPLDAQFSSSFLAVKLLEINACLTMHFVPLQSKEEVLEIFSNFDFSKLTTQE